MVLARDMNSILEKKIQQNLYTPDGVEENDDDDTAVYPAYFPVPVLVARKIDVDNKDNKPQVVGYTFLGPCRRNTTGDAELFLFVHPEHTGQGIDGSLLSMLLMMMQSERGIKSYDWMARGIVGLFTMFAVGRGFAKSLLSCLLILGLLIVGSGYPDGLRRRCLGRFGDWIRWRLDLVDGKFVVLIRVQLVLTRLGLIRPISSLIPPTPAPMKMTSATVRTASGTKRKMTITTTDFVPRLSKLLGGIEIQWDYILNQHGLPRSI